GSRQLLRRVAALWQSASEARDEEAGRRSLRRQICHLRRRDHVCFVYANKTEQMQGLVPWIQQRLTRGEKCRYIADDNSVSEIQHDLGASGIDVQRESDRGALIISTKRETYLADACFEPPQMMKLLQQDVDSCEKS